MSEQLKELEQQYKRSQIALAKAQKNNNVSAYLLFEAKQKEGVPLVNPVKKRERKEKAPKEPKAPKEKKEKAPKEPKAPKEKKEPAKKRGRPAATEKKD